MWKKKKEEAFIKKIYEPQHTHTCTHTSHSSINFSSKGRKAVKSQFSKTALICATAKKMGMGSLKFILWHIFAAWRQHRTPLTDNGLYFLSAKCFLFLKLKAEKVIRLTFTLATEWQGNFHTCSSLFYSFSIFLFSLHSSLFSLVFFFYWRGVVCWFVFFNLKSHLVVSIPR